MTTGTIMLYTGAAMVAVAVVVGIPAMVILRHVNQRIMQQVNTEFY